MVGQLSPEQFLHSAHKYVVLDVRSPLEHAAGHIPGATNLPLFSDEERSHVGITYKTSGPEVAMSVGLDIVGPKLQEMVSAAQRTAGSKDLLVHCWRGGKRSASVAWLLDFSGLPVTVLEGGYKGYRNAQRAWLEGSPLSLIVLGGATGSGKTDVLHAMAKRGEQVLDLEGLANHKGSAFGWIGEESQPSNEQYENDVIHALLQLDRSKRIWVENESRTIGKVFIPEALWLRMKESPLIHLEVPREQRVANLVKTYGGDAVRAHLAESFEKIAKRLGGQHFKAALEALDAGRYAEAAEIALVYYDKTYYYGLELSADVTVEKIETDNVDVDRTCQLLLDCAQAFQPQDYHL